MDKKIMLIVITFMSAVITYAQQFSVGVNYVTSDGSVSNNTIFYKPTQLLIWDDFKGKPVEQRDNAVALTNAGFGLKLAFHRVGNIAQLVISVNCNFSRKDSWVKNGNKTAYILNHEQKHFDIAFIHTVLFIQKLTGASLTSSNYATVIEKIYNEAAAAMSKMQNQYDVETNHSRISEKQSEWDAKISQQLIESVKIQGLL
jgi:hypothetical protein